MTSNNASCKVNSIGYIRLKISNGIVRKLSNVRHVLELVPYSNLLSLRHSVLLKLNLVPYRSLKSLRC